MLNNFFQLLQIKHHTFNIIQSKKKSFYSLLNFVTFNQIFSKECDCRLCIIVDRFHTAYEFAFIIFLQQNITSPVISVASERTIQNKIFMSSPEFSEKWMKVLHRQIVLTDDIWLIFICFVVICIRRDSFPLYVFDEIV